jgi:hypothetical protein
VQVHLLPTLNARLQVTDNLFQPASPNSSTTPDQQIPQLANLSSTSCNLLHRQGDFRLTSDIHSAMAH